VNNTTAVSAVIFDLDGTLTGTPNPWRYIHERLGIWDSARAEHELAAYRELAARRGALTPSAR